MPMDFEGGTQPPTLEEAVELILLNLNKEEKEALSGPDARLLHHGPGTAMRNGWNLWGVRPDAPKTLHEHFKERFQLGCADDMSGMIMHAVTARLKGEELDLNAEVKRYHDHWARQGVDPVTMRKTKKWWKL